MGPICVAITHQTLSTSEELRLLAEQRVGLGTSIRGTANAELGGNAKRDVELLSRLGTDGGVAVVTYGKDNPRWLCRFAPSTPVEAREGLRSLKIAEQVELPASLLRINTMGNAIRALSDSESEMVLTEASRLMRSKS